MHSKFCITVRLCFVFSRYFLQNKYHHCKELVFEYKISYSCNYNSQMQVLELQDFCANTIPSVLLEVLVEFNLSYLVTYIVYQFLPCKRMVA